MFSQIKYLQQKHAKIIIKPLYHKLPLGIKLFVWKFFYFYLTPNCVYAVFITLN